MECLGMIKRLSASTLVIFAVVSCKQLEQKSPQEKPEVSQEVNGEIDYTPKVINVNEIRFMPPEIRAKTLGPNWDKNESLTKFIDPDGVEIKVDMSKDRNVKLDYTKQFALKVSAKNSKGYGSVSISSQWLNADSKVTFKATPDSKATFLKWEGDLKNGVEIKGNEITVVMNQPRIIYAVYTSNESELSIDSKYGNPQGGGVYAHGKNVDWSITSPFEISDSVRVVAPVSKGNVKLLDDHVVKIDWSKEFMLKASTNSMGNVVGGNKWVKKGSIVTLLAVTEDPSIGFVGWEGVDSTKTKANPLTLTMDDAYIVKAIFAKQKYTLNIESAFAKATGTGLQFTNSVAKWSVKSPVATRKPDIRMAATPASGEVTMDGNKSVTVNWVKEFKVSVYTSTLDGIESSVEEMWIKDGEMLKNYTIKFPAESTKKVYSWGGNLPKKYRGQYPLNLTINRPTKLIGNLKPINTELVFNNNLTDELNKSNHLHTTNAKKLIPNVIYKNDGERVVLDTDALKKQVKSVQIPDKKTIKLEKNANIQIVDFAGWKQCVKIKTQFAQVIISPQAGRVVYFGSPDNKTNLLWLNEDHVGATTTKAQSVQDWADKGGSRVWIAPIQARAVLTGKSFPPAYEVDGAPFENTIISGNKVIVQNFASAAYGCKIERTFELKENMLYINTSLVKSSESKHHYLLGPVMLTQFARPDVVRFLKSADPKTHPAGYIMHNGTAPAFQVDKLDDSRFNIEVPKSYDKEWKFGASTSFAQMEFKNYIMNIDSTIGKSAVFPEKNCNMTFFAPEAPTDYIEVGNFGELYELNGTKHTSLVTWGLEKR